GDASRSGPRSRAPSPRSGRSTTSSPGSVPLGIARRLGDAETRWRPVSDADLSTRRRLGRRRLREEAEARGLWIAARVSTILLRRAADDVVAAEHEIVGEVCVERRLAFAEAGGLDAPMPDDEVVAEDRSRVAVLALAAVIEEEPGTGADHGVSLDGEPHRAARRARGSARDERDEPPVGAAVAGEVAGGPVEVVVVDGDAGHLPRRAEVVAGDQQKAAPVIDEHVEAEVDVAEGLIRGRRREAVVSDRQADRRRLLAAVVPGILDVVADDAGARAALQGDP